jgi:DNA polymerase
MKRFHEAGLLDDGWVDRYCKGPLWPECVRYRMEESGRPHPDWMLPDGTLDERLRHA